MPEFGKRGGGGRRWAERMMAPLPALVTTLTDSHSAVLVNVSRTGARLRGTNLPHEREELMIKVEGLSVLGTVAWSRNDQCGVFFSEPLSNYDLKRLKREASLASFTRLCPEDRQALQDWLIGIAR